MVAGRADPAARQRHKARTAAGPLEAGLLLLTEFFERENIDELTQSDIYGTIRKLSGELLNTPQWVFASERRNLFFTAFFGRENIKIYLVIILNIGIAILRKAIINFDDSVKGKFKSGER